MFSKGLMWDIKNFRNLVNWGCKKSHIKAGAGAAAAMYEQMVTHGQTKQFVT